MEGEAKCYQFQVVHAKVVVFHAVEHARHHLLGDGCELARRRGRLQDEERVERDHSWPAVR